MQLVPLNGQVMIGDVLAVMKPGGLVKHFGVFVGCDPFGAPVVVSASAIHGRVVAQTFTEFCTGQCPEYYRVASRRLSEAEITRRALHAIGTPYELFKANCEHLVRHIHGFMPVSPQVLAWLTLAGSTAVVLGAAALIADN